MTAAAELRAEITSAEALSHLRYRAQPWVLAALLTAGILGGAAYQFAGEQPRGDTRSIAAGTAGMAEGEFRLPEAEMRALRIEPVVERDFRPERLIEGRIAYDEEGVTPVLSPYNSARVLRAVAQAGDTVHRGDTLFEVESADLLRAESELLSRIDDAAKARVALNLARWNLARQSALLRARAASQRDLERAEADATSAATELRTSEAALATVRARLGVLGRSPQQIAEIEATRRPSAVVAVTAPIDGTVVQRRLGPGQWLGADTMEPAYTIADLSTVWLIGMARDADIPLLRLGQSLEAIVDALPGRVFEARITRLATNLDPRTRRLEICAELQAPDGALKPGMQASLRIALGEARRAVGVPAGALLGGGAEAAVWLAIGEDRIGLRRVRLGIRLGDEVEIVEGLKPGERIVTGGALFLGRPRMA
jgi:cobalt-zinc-cadmium efflux system membrane fusion protein